MSLSDILIVEPGALREFAPAKVNLCLHVTGRRQDGYHLLDSLVVFAGVGDWISAEPAERLSLNVGGPFAAGLSADTGNLVLRAAQALAPAGARLHLDKQLPVASGIGGGSADAAATLRLLTRLWGVEADLPAIGARLGADVPVCLAGHPARMRGVGELVDPTEAPACGLVLVNPGVAVATRTVFAARAGNWSDPLPWPPPRGSAAFVAWLGRTGNDLEAPAIALCPAIADVLAALRAGPGCRLARMSGSGATCYALTETPAQARVLSAGLAGRGWWSWGGGLWQRGERGLGAQPEQP